MRPMRCPRCRGDRRPSKVKAVGYWCSGEIAHLYRIECQVCGWMPVLYADKTRRAAVVRWNKIIRAANRRARKATA